MFSHIYKIDVIKREGGGGLGEQEGRGRKREMRLCLRLALFQRLACPKK